MSSNTTIFLAPTTVSFRSLWGSSHDIWTCASTPLALLHHLAQPLDGGMVDQEVTGQDRHSPLRCQLGYRLGVPDAQGERLLDHDGLACFYRLSSHRSVGGGRRRHNDGIHDLKQRRHVG